MRIIDWISDVCSSDLSARTVVNRSLSSFVVYTEYLLLAAIGLFLASRLGTSFFYTSLLFIFSGLMYNLKPFRTKDKAYLQVISESITTHIRLTLRGTMVYPTTLPPGSLLLAHWTGGGVSKGS